MTRWMLLLPTLFLLSSCAYYDDDKTTIKRIEAHDKHNKEAWQQKKKQDDYWKHYRKEYETSRKR